MRGLLVDITRVQQKLHLETLQAIIKRANLSSVGPTITYYTLLSLVPVLMTVGSIAGLAGLNTQEMMTLIKTNLPENVASILVPILKSVLQGNVGVLSFSLFVTIWGASRVIAIIRKAFNAVYDVPERINGLLTRIFSFLWLMVLLAVAALILLLGSVSKVAVTALPFDLPWLDALVNSSNIVSFFGLWILLSIFNLALPATRLNKKALVIGSGVEVLLLLILNQGFTLYAQFAVTNVGFYQTLGSLLVLMVYLNLLATILVVGQIIIAWLTELWNPANSLPASLPAAAKGQRLPAKQPSNPNKTPIRSHR
jgi:membrane protein